MGRIIFHICLLLLSLRTAAQETRIVVDPSGHGDFRTIQDAINSLPDEAAAPRIIFVRKGVYQEKLFIWKNNLILQGEDREQTIITCSLARDAWRCAHPDDWGAATINLRGSDLTLRDLTVVNSYGWDHPEPQTEINCATDSVHPVKAVSREGHQMALRSFQTTRLRVINCNLKAYGGDTVSPWNVGGGLFYFKDCRMEGGVDFYCPRGWAYADHCTFVADDGPACIWHDGSVDPDSKSVLVDCDFSGYDGFRLGRYHKDAQFYLIRCRFGANMADQDIYLVPTANTIRWGKRVYYSGCRKDGKQYGWYTDNLASAPGSPDAAAINADWVFGKKWHPVADAGRLAEEEAAAQGPTAAASSQGQIQDPAQGIRPLVTADRLAALVMERWPDSGKADAARWTYESAVVWLGMMKLWYSTGDARYYHYVKRQVDRLVDQAGNIATYRPEDDNLDNILGGRLLLQLYAVTEKSGYYEGAARLRQQLREQPRTGEGSFWHKKKYPEQVWLDGIYMALPFWAHYAALFHEDSVFDDVARQFAAIERHTRDTGTGLLYHGWDELAAEKWAVRTRDVTDGHSPNFWGRAMGWYGMALVDALDYFPADHPGRQVLLRILRRYAAAIAKVQDSNTGLWWDVPDKPGATGNFREASASAMFVYTLAKGIRKGFLASPYRDVAERGWKGICDQFIRTGADGVAVLRGTVGVSGLGGTPYRDGSYGYYTSEKLVEDDPKGIGAVMMAATEMDALHTSRGRGGKTVLLDYYFNNERRKDITGASVRYHYTWEDRANSGFSLLGYLFRQYGARTDSLETAPSAANLRKASVYIIVDPDDDREVKDPHYVLPEEIRTIDDWVKAGGVLMLMSNDSANAEFDHFNKLAETFGIHFNFDDYHKVLGSNYDMGAFNLPGNDAIFRSAHKIYIKEESTLRLRPPAVAHFSDDGHVIMAVAKFGRGTVFAVGDPWFYNEYTDGRKLPPAYENYNAARDLVQWLLSQAH